MDGPKSSFTRYAFGYSDEKPGADYWIVLAVVTVGAVVSFIVSI